MATAWPSAMHDESDILMLDEHGQSVVCRMCCVQYAIYGGEEPEPVAMNAPFCMQAWSEHQRSVHAEPQLINAQERDVDVKIEQTGDTAISCDDAERCVDTAEVRRL